ncbi:hypothetical protein L2K70_20170 [Nocardioides KLBMP 9356]|uniref:Phosphodiesterase n=1 Tax=Nocardioides potassii TaxID=2911371 RepID=A0ABS9HHY1_9ACTN|nr:hypothetical protein [Nocardioides potassii]MCF6379936.1 hypothetical protein [Nocardioides potassii]
MPAPYRRAFELLARTRSAPAFHPDGALYEGLAVVRGPGPLPEGDVACLVRLSKGIGTPRGAPDLLGVAIRLLHDPPIDVLCTSAPGDGSGWRRFVLRPARRWGGITATSLMQWSRAGRRMSVLVEMPRGLGSPEPDVLVDRLPTTLALRVVDRDGHVQAGTIEVLRRSQLERPAFDPVLYPPPSWRLAPRWLSALRERAYVGSRDGQRGRPSDRAV